MTTNQPRPTKSSTNTARHYEAGRNDTRQQAIPSESLMYIRLATKSATVDQIVRYSLKSKEVGASNRFYLERWAERCGSVRLQLI